MRSVKLELLAAPELKDYLLGIEGAYVELADFYSTNGLQWPATFAFIDPFGWAGAPFSIVKEILSRRSCEVLVTFMYEEINRFIGHPEQKENFDRFFETTDWRDGIDLINPRDRNRFLHDLYYRQLREDAGANFVRSSQMRNDRDVTDYYPFYATNNLLGMAKMKEAMWKIDQSSEFAFSDATNPDQIILFGNEPDFPALHNKSSKIFPVELLRLEKFVLSETAFRETLYKVHILKRMEEAVPPLINIIDAPSSRRRGTFASADIKLQFAPA